MDMTLIEYEYLEKKLENPNEKVYCPRCGGEIVLEIFKPLIMFIVKITVFTKQ